MPIFNDEPAATHLNFKKNPSQKVGRVSKNFSTRKFCELELVCQMKNTKYYASSGIRYLLAFSFSLILVDHSSNSNLKK
jgi:hypothetical protein